VNGPVLRAPVLWLTGQRWFRSLITEHSIGRRVALRFVAGEALDACMKAARELDRHGIATMLDHLGENVASKEQAGAAADAYVQALRRVHEADDLDANISIKLTQLGLDVSFDLAMENAERVLQAAAARRTLVMIDMEAHEYVDPTLQAHRELKRQFAHVGLAMQSYLYRTHDDVEALPPGSTVRLVKGAYLEPHDVAFARGHTVHVASHDPRMTDGARRYVERNKVDWGRVEFQFLYGIRRDIQSSLAKHGYPVRVYVPYGDEWYPYLTRRMAERPANMWFFVSQFLRYGAGR
jgi:proline dehydrogenase